MPASHGDRQVTTQSSGVTTFNASVSTLGDLNGKLLLCVQNVDAGALSTLTTPTGGETWLLLTSLATASSPVIRSKIWWKIGGASEPTQYGMGQNSGADSAVTIIRVDDADTTATPIFGTPAGGASGGTTITCPTATPAGTDDLEYRIACGNSGTGASWSFAALSPDLTELPTNQSNDFSNHGIAYRQLSSGSAVGTVVATNTDSQSGRQAYTVLIKSADTTVTGTMDVQLPALQAAGAGTVTVEAGLDVTLPALQADMAADVRVSGGLDAALPALTASFDGSLTVIAELGAVLPALDFSGVGDLGVSGVFDATLPALQAAGAGVVTVSGGLGAELPALSFAGSGVSTVSAALNATLPALEFAGQGEIAETVRGTLSVVLPALQADMAGSVVVVGEMDATLPALIFTGAGISYVSGYTIGAITGPSSTTEPTATGPAVRPDLVLIGPAVRWDSSGPAVRYGATGPSSTTEPTATGPASNTEPTATGPAIGRDVSGPAVSREISGVGV